MIYYYYLEDSRTHKTKLILLEISAYSYKLERFVTE